MRKLGLGKCLVLEFSEVYSTREIIRKGKGRFMKLLEPKERANVERIRK